MLFVTPEVDIYDFKISISKDRNVKIKIFPDHYHEIPSSKQSKMTMQI